MVKRGAIEAAIRDHQQWKMNLQEAIITGQSDYDAKIVKKDNICLFGQWINNLTDEEKSSDDFKNVKALHTEFHLVAGEILETALTGERREALKKLHNGFEYDNISQRLILAMHSWKERLKL